MPGTNFPEFTLATIPVHFIVGTAESYPLIPAMLSESNFWHCLSECLQHLQGVTMNAHTFPLLGTLAVREKKKHGAPK